MKESRRSRKLIERLEAELFAGGIWKGYPCTTISLKTMSNTRLPAPLIKALEDDEPSAMMAAIPAEGLTREQCEGLITFFVKETTR